ncbi:hypothetical protein ABEB36_015546 [Hypothenemus hampei]|uniref:Uncharacterized protein n=1 Tax=Hypothenemus hampei TaxID=57062 RepID=A0ABD1DZG1_HYPHA
MAYDAQYQNKSAKQPEGHSRYSRKNPGRWHRNRDTRDPCEALTQISMVKYHKNTLLCVLFKLFRYPRLRQGDPEATAPPSRSTARTPALKSSSKQARPKRREKSASNR